jgi:hypothetical protein
MLYLWAEPDPIATYLTRLSVTWHIDAVCHEARLDAEAPGHR